MYDRQPAAGPIHRQKLRDTGRRLCQVVTELHAQGWAQGTGGNMSVTLSRDPLRLLVTQSGRDKRRLDPASDLVVIGRDGHSADGEDGRPSAEALLHSTIAAAAGAGSTLHTHSVAATLLGEHFLPRGSFTLTGYEMQKGLAGVRSHEEKVRVPVLANSQDMEALSGEVAALVESEPEVRGFLLAGHGLYTWGATLGDAKRHVEIFEFLFECVARRVPFAPFTG